MLKTEINEALDLARTGYSDQQIADYFFPLTIESLHESIGRGNLQRVRIRQTKPVIDKLWEKANGGHFNSAMSVLANTIGWGEKKSLTLSTKDNEPLKADHTVTVKLDNDTISRLQSEIEDEYG